MYKFKCVKCGITPENGWLYMPDDGDKIDYFFCDDCVPRGCSCQMELKEGVNEESDEACDPKNYYDLLDEKGRKLPCCEYWFTDNEFEAEQRFEKGEKNGNV